MTKLFSDACEAKEAELCVREDNPAAGVRGPYRLEDRASPYLFPSEFLRLAACEGVPLHWRQIYTLSTYLYLRGGELAALEWADVNLERRYVLVHRALDTDSGQVKSTKTKRVRKVPIEPALLPLLREMHDEAEGEGLVIEMPPTCEWAASLRRHLHLAGVTRADLFADDETRRQVNFHDLRHTGITWRAVRGDAAFDIKDGAGHRDLETTQRYVNEARTFADDFGEVFPPLPRGLAQGLSPICPPIAGSPVSVASPGGFEHDRTVRARSRRSSRKHGGQTTCGDSKQRDISASADEPPGEPPGPGPAEDPVEFALASALSRAAEAGRFDLVAQLARELDARRCSQTKNVVRMDARRRGGP